MSSDDLTIREDEWSWQLLGPPQTKLFVRVANSNIKSTSLIFSDFIIHSAPEEMVIHALESVADHFGELSGFSRLVFENILPGVDTNSIGEREMLVRRHDQIVKSIKEFGIKHGVRVKNTLLDQRHGRYDTVVELS